MRGEDTYDLEPRGNAVLTLAKEQEAYLDACDEGEFWPLENFCASARYRCGPFASHADAEKYIEEHFGFQCGESEHGDYGVFVSSLSSGASYRYRKGFKQSVKKAERETFANKDNLEEHFDHDAEEFIQPPKHSTAPVPAVPSSWASEGSATPSQARSLVMEGHGRPRSQATISPPPQTRTTNCPSAAGDADESDVESAGPSCSVVNEQRCRDSEAATPKAPPKKSDAWSKLKKLMQARKKSGLSAEQVMNDGDEVLECVQEVMTAEEQWQTRSRSRDQESLLNLVKTHASRVAGFIGVERSADLSQALLNLQLLIKDREDFLSELRTDPLNILKKGLSDRDHEVFQTCPQALRATILQSVMMNIIQRGEDAVMAAARMICDRSDNALSVYLLGMDGLAMWERCQFQLMQAYTECVVHVSTENFIAICNNMAALVPSTKGKWSSVRYNSSSGMAESVYWDWAALVLLGEVLAQKDDARVSLYMSDAVRSLGAFNSKVSKRLRSFCLVSGSRKNSARKAYEILKGLNDVYGTSTSHAKFEAAAKEANTVVEKVRSSLLHAVDIEAQGTQAVHEYLFDAAAEVMESSEELLRSFADLHDKVQLGEEERDANMALATEVPKMLKDLTVQIIETGSDTFTDEGNDIMQMTQMTFAQNGDGEATGAMELLSAILSLIVQFPATASAWLLLEKRVSMILMAKAALRDVLLPSGADGSDGALKSKLGFIETFGKICTVEKNALAITEKSSEHAVAALTTPENTASLVSLEQSLADLPMTTTLVSKLTHFLMDKDLHPSVLASCEEHSALLPTEVSGLILGGKASRSLKAAYVRLQEKKAVGVVEAAMALQSAEKAPEQFKSAEVWKAWHGGVLQSFSTSVRKCMETARTEYFDDFEKKYHDLIKDATAMKFENHKYLHGTVLPQDIKEAVTRVTDAVKALPVWTAPFETLKTINLSFASPELRNDMASLYHEGSLEINASVHKAAILLGVMFLVNPLWLMNSGAASVDYMNKNMTYVKSKLQVADSEMPSDLVRKCKEMAAASKPSAPEPTPTENSAAMVATEAPGTRKFKRMKKTLA